MVFRKLHFVNSVIMYSRIPAGVSLNNQYFIKDTL